MSDSAAQSVEFQAEISEGIEYATGRPCQIGRITYRYEAHDYVALAYRLTDEPDKWRLTWIAAKGGRDATRLPEGIWPSEGMLAALEVAPIVETHDALA